MNPPFKRHFLHRGLLIATFIAAVQSGTTHADPTLELYVDTVTNRVYTKPGKNRIKLGTFEKVDTPKQKAKQRVRKAEKVREEQIHKRLDTLDEKVQDIWVAEKAVEEHLTPLEERAKRFEKLYEDVTSPETFAAALKEKWYERISIRGYTQFRYEWLASEEGAPLNVPNDQCINNSDFCIRRPG